MLFLLLSCFFLTYASIGVGIISDRINIWRYWEKIGNDYQYKIIIFNISDSTISFKMEQEDLKDSTKKKMRIPEVTINKSEYKIYDLDFFPGEYFSFYVNGVYAGLLPMSNQLFPGNNLTKKFISNEGLNGRHCGCWLTKNNLFAADKSIDTLTLHVNYNPKSNVTETGALTLELSPSRDYENFSVIINNSAAGAFNIKGHYQIELPYHASEYIMKGNKFSDPNPQTDIQVIYSVKLLNKIFLGLNYYSRIEVPDEKMVHHVKTPISEAAELPVFVK